ncbi:unnamed protein product [Closterium sp. NIES-64]|nr:unnamed protein product [Closterium sp. NIES-64]
MEAGLVVRGEVVEEAVDLQGLGEGSLACRKAISDLLHAPHIVNCAITGGEGDGEVLLEQGADRADVATLEHRLELGPDEGGAHLASLETAHKGTRECAKEDGAGAVISSGPCDAPREVVRHGRIVLIKERQAIGAFRYREVVVVYRNFILRLADEVFAAIVEKCGIGGILERRGSGDFQGGFSGRRTRRNGGWRGFAGVNGCCGLEGLRAAEEDVDDAVRSDECILENTADAPDEGMSVDRRAVRGKLKLVDGGGVNGRGERGRSGSHEGRRRVDPRRPRVMPLLRDEAAATRKARWRDARVVTRKARR